jgi:transcriptional regulator with XRE-family HTH domain
MNSFGERLRMERERLGLNQAEMAALFSSHKNTQYAYENDQQSPTAATLALLAKAGVDIYFLFYGNYVDAAATQQMAETLKVLHGLTPTHQALGFGMLSMLHATLTDSDTSASKATNLWQAVQLFNHFLAASPDERLALMETAKVLRSPPGDTAV